MTNIIRFQLYVEAKTKQNEQHRQKLLVVTMWEELEWVGEVDEGEKEVQNLSHNINYHGGESKAWRIQ